MNTASDRPRSLFDKIWTAHAIVAPTGQAQIIAIDRVFLHERTGPAALNRLAARDCPILDPGRVFAVMDHIVDTQPGRTDRTLMPGGQAFIAELRAATARAGITTFDINDPAHGIVHVISPELGIVVPGATLVCPDSHTCTQGAFGALAWGIGSTEAEHALATGTLRLMRPSAMRITVDGLLEPGVTAKDLALHLIATFGSDCGRGHVIEFAGSAIDALDMEARMTLCNMATEMSAFSGIIAPDARTYAWLAGRRFAPTHFDAPYWAGLHTDADAAFDRDVRISGSDVAPMVSWGTSPSQSIAVTGAIPADAPTAACAYIGMAPGAKIAGTPVDAAFIGSCTNGRLSDLRRAAAILKGRHVAPSVKKALVVPGSASVRRAAEAEGLDRVFTDAGFEWRLSGCSLCFYAGGEGFPEGSRTISSTNRNFEGRQGPGIRTHIAAPETVAASAITGVITDPRALMVQAPS